MADEVISGLDSAEEPIIKETRPKTGGLNIAGSKGVSLEPENSMEVRNRLLELIKQREAERSGFGALLDRLAISAQSPGTSFQSRLDAYNKNQQARNQDIFNMQLGVSQLDTEQKRLAQARAQEIADREQFGLLVSGKGPGSAPTAAPGADGSIASPQQVQAFAKNLSGDQAATLMMLYRKNPIEATKQMIMLTKDTDLQRNLRSAGVQEGSDAWNNAILANTLPGAGGTEQIPDPDNPGFFKTVPKTEAIRSNIGISTPPKAVGPLSAASEDQQRPVYDRLTAPAPATAPIATRTAPASQARVMLENGNFAMTPEQWAKQINSEKDTPAETKASLIARYKEGYEQLMQEQAARNKAKTTATSTAPAQRFTSPAAQSVMNTVNPYPKTDIANYSKFEEEKQKKALELETESKKVAIEGRKTEAQDLGKASAAEQTALTETVSRNRDNDIYAKRIVSTVNNIPKEVQKDVFGILNHSDFKSAMLNFISQGVQTPIGSLSLPALADIATQLSPSVRRQQRADGTNPVLEASQQIKSDVARLTLAFTQAANKGQGAVSDSERQIYMKAVADPTRSSADMIKLMAISVQLAASHAAQTQGAWDNAQKAGLSWSDFKRSDKYKEMIANQIKESEEKLIPNRRR